MLADPPLVLQKRSDQLICDVKADIEKNRGWIGFDHFMNQALYTPDLGYYSGGMQKFGEDGDFVTAPMLGDFFAFALAGQCDEIFQQLEHGGKQPGSATLSSNREKVQLNDENVIGERIIIEFGAGDGQLVVGILRQMEKQDLRIDRYWIVETSDDLQHRQREAVNRSGLKYACKVSWLAQLPESGFEGVVIANELLDALPVKRFEIVENGKAMEMGVGIDEQGLTWKRSNHALADEYQARLSSHRLPVGYQSEIGIQAEVWVRSVGEKLKRGAMLLIDYGFPEREYYHVDRKEGTLMCHYRHQAHSDPFFYPGLQDITAHIDFSAVAAAGKEVGLTLSGYSPQGGFLLSLGILDYLAARQDSLSSDSKKYFELTRQIKMLTLPHEMGELFKVMVLSAGSLDQLTGFSLQDHGARL